MRACRPSCRVLWRHRVELVTELPAVMALFLSEQPDVIGSEDDGDAGLVETPETQPKPKKRAPRARKPRAPKADADQASAPAEGGGTTEAAE